MGDKIVCHPRIFWILKVSEATKIVPENIWDLPLCSSDLEENKGRFFAALRMTQNNLVITLKSFVLENHYK